MKIQFRNKELIIFESTLFRTTTSLVIGDEYILLIDPNWLPIELDFIEKMIQSIGKNKQKYLLFTHSDYDHIIGYGKFKDYKTIASKEFIENEKKADILKEIQKFDDQYYIKRSYEIEYPEIEISIVKDDQKLKIGSDQYHFYQAKGHNKDGIIIFNKTKEMLFVGDYLSNIEFPYIYHSVANYMETLSKLENIINKKPIKTLVSGHGDCTTDMNEMLKRVEESNTYITELVSSIVEQKEFNETKLFSQYEFPIIMNQFHQNNIKLAKIEFNAK